MEKKIQTQLETQIEWLNNELEKDRLEVERKYCWGDGKVGNDYRCHPIFVS